MELELPYVAEQGFDGLYGLQITELSAEHAAGSVMVAEHHKQPAGLVHGGVLASIAESLASLGTASEVWQQGKVVTGMTNQSSFLRPIVGGTIHARAVSRHRGRTTWIWDVEITDDDDRLCALTRMTIAVRDKPQ